VAILDCATRKAAAFPVADKLTKPAWLTITVVSGVLPSLPVFYHDPLNIISLIALIVSLVT